MSSLATMKGEPMTIDRPWRRIRHNPGAAPHTSPPARGRGGLTGLYTLLLLASIVLGARAHAAEPLTFNIPSQSLTSALNAFAKVTGLQVSFAAELAAGLTSPGVSGLMTPDEALRRLLSGTGVTYRFTNDRTVTLERILSPPKDARLQLEPTTVEGQSLKIEETQVTAERERIHGYVAEDATTATKTDTPILETPQAVSVVTGDLMKDRKPQDANEALATVPGFAPAVEYLFDQAYSLRGFMVGNDTLYQKYRDGRRFPQTVPLDPDLIERIEVIKGPASVLYGQIEPGGLVNYVSKRPFLDYTGGWIEQGFSRFNQFKTVTDVNGALGANVAFRLPLSFATGDSFRNHVGSETYNAAPSFTWKVNDRTRFSLLATLGRREQTDDTIGKPIVEGKILALPRSRFLGEPSFKNTIEHASVSVELEHAFTEDLMLRSSYAYFIADRDVRYALNNFASPLTGTRLERFGGTDKAIFEGHQIQHDLMWNMSLLGMRHELLLGVDALWASRDDLITLGFLPSIDIFNPVYDSTLSGPFIFDNYLGIIDSQLVGVYVQDQVTLLENLPAIHQLTLLFGGRWDFAKETLETSGTIFFATPLPARINNKEFSPRVALLWMPMERFSLYSSYSESFLPQDPEAFVTAVNGNPDPTLGEQYEVGAKYQLSPRLFTSVALFHITKTNIPGPDPSNPLLTELAGEVRSRGVEFELNGEILPRWQVAAGYAFIDSEVTEDDSGNVGKRLFAAPKNVLGLWTSYTFGPGGPLAGVGFGGGVHHVSRVFTDNSNLVSVPAYTTADLALWYRPQWWGPLTPEFSLNVKNVADEHYFTAGNGFSAVQDGAARSAIGSIRFPF